MIKIYTNIIDINNEIENGIGVTPELFYYTSLFSFGFTMSQIYDIKWWKFKNSKNR